MRLTTEPLDLPHMESDDESQAIVDLGVDRPRRTTPSLAKAIAYKRDRRFVMSGPHADRRNWPRAKASEKQAQRRRVAQTLRPALGTVAPEIDDFAPAFPSTSYSARKWRHASIPLGQWVNDKLEKRLYFVGVNIGFRIEDERFRRRLVPFLESLVSGRYGHSVELARRFAHVLDKPSHYSWRVKTDRFFGLDVWRDRIWLRALTELFEEQPEWEAKLRAWIAEVAPAEPPPDEPAWKRIRRLRKRSAQ